MNGSSWIDINLSHLRANVGHWRAILSNDSDSGTTPMICGVVKANGYGLGAVQIARALVDAGVEMLCVYSPSQADELFAAGQPGPGGGVLVLQSMHEIPVTDSLLAAANKGQLHLTVDSADQLKGIERLGRTARCRIPVHLHLDTGMARAGMSPDQFTKALTMARSLRHVRIAGACTHFATVREDVGYMDEQLERFDYVLASSRQQLPDPDEVIVHVGSTAPARRSSRYHRSMVRIGLGLYGYGTDDVTGGPMIFPPPAAAPLRPILRWRSSIVHLQRHPTGSTVGYTRTHTLSRDSLIGVVPAGYGDGYPIALSNKSMILLISQTGQAVAAPVVGRVSMDQITIDLTDAERHLGSIDIGAEVELISDNAQSPCALHRLAAIADSTCYEMLCRLSSRVERRYVTESGTGQPSINPFGSVPTSEIVITPAVNDAAARRHQAVVESTVSG